VTDKQTDRQTDKKLNVFGRHDVQKRDGQTDRQTDRQTKNSTFLAATAAGEIRAPPNLAW